MAKINIKVEILLDNYVARDRYKINIYKQGSVIPILTRDLLENSYRIQYFEGLDDTAVYDAEVIHFCDRQDGTQTENRRRQRVYSAQTGGCACPTNYVPNVNNTRCVRTLIAAPLTQNAGLTVASGPNDGAYSRDGMRVYAPAFNSAGQGGLQFLAPSSHSYWCSGNNAAQGRLNIAGVWNSAHASNPLNTWLGFTHVINATANKVYYIGIGADDFARIRVNGVVVVNQQLVALTSNNHLFWHIYPVFLYAGVNIIELDGLNTSGNGCWAGEIYDCDLLALQNVTPGTESSLNRQFSTFTKIGQTFRDGTMCSDGYALDLSVPGAPVCKKIDYTSCI
jgi:hypothetical protein